MAEVVPEVMEGMYRRDPQAKPRDAVVGEAIIGACEQHSLESSGRLLAGEPPEGGGWGGVAAQARW